jgi:hypothetical protein
LYRPAQPPARILDTNESCSDRAGVFV